MLKTIALRQILPLIVVVFLATFANAQTSDADLSVAEQRQIIETLLKEKFKESGASTIYVSTANLSDELKKEFPIPKNKKVQFVSGENAAQVCAYEFGEFEVIGRFVSISLGNCNEGLAYDFKKFGDRWKSVGLTIPK